MLQTKVKKYNNKNGSSNYRGHVRSMLDLSDASAQWHIPMPAAAAAAAAAE